MADHDPDPDDAEDLEDEDDDDDENDDDDDDDDEDDDDADPEDRADRVPRAAAGAYTDAPAPAAMAVPPVGGVPPPLASERPRASRVGSWLPLLDDRVGYVHVYRVGQGGRSAGGYLCRLTPPFPTGSLEGWLFRAYGPGKYRILERGHPPERVYLGSLTVTVGEQHSYAAAPPPVAPFENGNGYAPPPPQIAQVPPGTDYRLALVTVGLPLLAGAVTEFAKAIATRPQKSELETLIQAAKILNTPNEERTKLVREGMQLYRELSESAPRADSGELFNVRDILSGVGELLRAWRQGQPAPAAPAAQPAAAPAKPSPAAELQAASGETPESFVERVIVTEIQRAVGSADSPECLVILIESWLPSHVVAWLEGSPDEEVLEELPKKFPAHADYLKQTGVQDFIRRALQMLREDPDQPDLVLEGGAPRVREHASAAAGG